MATKDDYIGTYMPGNAGTYITRSEIDGFKRDARDDYRRLEDHISKLVEQVSRIALAQEHVAIVGEETNKRFEETRKQIESLTSAVREVETRRIENKAIWNFIFGFKNVWIGLGKMILMVAGMSLVSNGTADFFRYAKACLGVGA